MSLTGTWSDAPGRSEAAAGCRRPARVSRHGRGSGTAAAPARPRCVSAPSAQHLPFRTRPPAPVPGTRCRRAGPRTHRGLAREVSHFLGLLLGCGALPAPLPGRAPRPARRPAGPGLAAGPGTALPGRAGGPGAGAAPGTRSAAAAIAVELCGRRAGAGLPAGR